MSFVQIENRSKADIRISFPSKSFNCAGEKIREGSCGLRWGYSIDSDDAHEYYSGYEIRIRNIDEDAVGWHIGSRLTYAFGLSGEEIPEPFVDADYDDRREWWK